MKISERYRYATNSKAKAESVIRGDKYRFTILTPRLIRAEYNETGYFEDRATQTVINRDFPKVEFSVKEDEEKLVINTAGIELTYYKRRFSENSLFVKYVGKNSKVFAGKMSSTTWGFTTENAYNLKGTARTLDGIDGACDLEDGLMNKNGLVTVLDDSESLIIAEDGWIEARSEKYIDTYLFCYGDAKSGYDYKGCLKDFYVLCGKTPLIPKYALGNWWSRYHAYTQEEYTDLMKRFKEEEIPFSVAVIDMDWHYTDIDSKYGSGWTGYSWNKKLFPNHKEFLKLLHDEGLEVSLNLHPQQGVAAHEDAYKSMAEAMGIDPETEKTVEFDITDAKFIENYFEKLHHPLEEEGVDFWWMDWQQGNNTKIEGLDPLWMLNHYHYVDNDKGDRRPLMFSRYAGPGSHRYPIGFSGDTYITWESLDFQPYFTANASNIGYGWWSHDIGGHMGGYRDGELTARWVQLGVFSPINRLHSSNSRFMGKEPWKFNKICEISMKKFLKLRYEMMPYLYTMNYRASEMGEPLVMPMYYNWHKAEAYANKNQYIFGTEMIVKPITTPCDKVTQMGSTDVWFPSGEWYDFFTNRRYSGNKTMAVYRDLYNMPVFVKAGGIIPMTGLQNVNGIDNPENLKIRVYAGADNVFELYEDDGKSKAYKDGGYAVTKMEFVWDKNVLFKIYAPLGDIGVIPSSRSYEIEFIGIEKPESIQIVCGKTELPYTCEICEGVCKIKIDKPDDDVEIILTNVEMKKNSIMEDMMRVLENMETDNNLKEKVYGLTVNSSNKTRLVAELSECGLDKNAYQAIVEILTAEE